MVTTTSARLHTTACLALLLFAIGACLLTDGAEAQMQQTRGQLPKTRMQLKLEREEKQRLRRMAQAEEERQREIEAQLRKAAAERQKQWRAERRRLRDAFMAKERRKKEAAEAEKAKQELEARLRQKEQQKIKQQKEQQLLLEQQQQGKGRDEQEKTQESEREGIVGGRLDCFGIPGGSARFDACGVCGGDDSTCSDCAGVPNGNATEDCAGVCNGNDMSCLDCAGVMNGPAQIDACGVCEGDGSSCLDCMGVINGTAQLDVCGVCNGDGTTCVDCHGKPNGPAKLDPCGVCEGDGTTCCSPLQVKKQSGADAAGDQDSSSNNNNGVPVDVGKASDVELCSGHGTCSYRHHFCVCDRGWTGPFCSVEQNLCLHHQEIPEQADPCNKRGQCDPSSGICRCWDPTSWFGTRCEFHHCNMRGAYDLEQGRCHCQHGYGGQYCERCASLHPSVGKSHVCLQIVGAWQPVPEDLRLERSILLGETNPKAPVFVLIDAHDQLAESYVAGNSFLNLMPVKRWHGIPVGDRKLGRDAIWPNSTHKASGYYYDCGCRLAAPPPAPTPASADDPSGDSQEKMMEKRSSDNATASLLVGRPYRPYFPGHSEYTDPQLSVQDRRKQQKRMRVQSARERWLTKRAPATLMQCQGLVQEVLDEFGFALNAATAEFSALSAAIGDVSSTCGSEVGFGYAFFLLTMLVVIFVAFLTLLCIWCGRRYITFRGPLKDL